MSFLCVCVWCFFFFFYLMLWWIYLNVFDFYSDFSPPSHTCKWYSLGGHTKNLFILQLLLLLGLMFRCSEFQLQTLLPRVLQSLNTSVLACSQEILTMTAFFFLMLKYHCCRFFCDRFFHKPVSSFSLQESGHACYFSSILAAMASKCLVMFSESYTLYPWWYWICFYTAEIKCWTDLATCLMGNS